MRQFNVASLPAGQASVSKPAHRQMRRAVPARTLKPNRTARLSSGVSRLAPLHASSGQQVVKPLEEKLDGWSYTSVHAWQQMRNSLREANVRFLSGQEVKWALERGALLVDVRTPAEYEGGHIPGAINVPLYQPITGWTPWKVARRLAFAFFGVFNGTELNTDFLLDLAVLAPELDAELCVYCGLGGSIDDSGVEHGFKVGTQTRATIASYFLVAEGGYGNVALLKGGFVDWAAGGRDIVGEAPANKGHTDV